MNNTYFNKDIFPQYNQNNKENIPINTNYIPNITEQPYLENILKLNKGKQVKVYMTFPNTNEIQEFKGIIEQIGNNYIALSEPSTGKWHLLPIMYLSYITFDENINYNNWFK